MTWLVVVYATVAVVATLIGSITGIGGGVILKPVMDAMGHFDAVTIGLLSSVTVFFMALTACVRQRKMAGDVPKRKWLCLGGGAVGGGFSGQLLFSLLTKGVDNDTVKLVQNSILASLVAVIFVYMLVAEKLPTLKLKNLIFYLLAGIGMGVCASFLGVGGGPINVAILMLFFSLDLKQATFASVVIILFSQFSKLFTLLLTEFIAGAWFGGYTLTALPYMVVSAIIGSLTGSLIKPKINEKALKVCFNAMQLLVLAICMFNVFL